MYAHLFTGQLEEEHRRHGRLRHDGGLASQKSARRVWTTGAKECQEQAVKAEEALRCGQKETREYHYREIDTIEGDFVDSKARFHQSEEGKTERQKVGKAAETEKHDVEMTAVELGRNTWSEEGFPQEAKLESSQRDIDHKDRGPRDEAKEVSSDKGTRCGTLEYMRVVSDLEVERKRVAELESRLKDVNSNAKATTMTDRGSDPLLVAALESEDEDEDDGRRVSIDKFTELEDKLARALRENEDLRSNMAQAQDTLQSDQIGSKGQERSELYLAGALEEANARSSKLEKVKRLRCFVKWYPT